MRQTAALVLMILGAISFIGEVAQADLLGYWSANSTAGEGTIVPNDQGNADLDGEIVGAYYTNDGDGHTGLPGDYAITFPGEDDDYVVIPPTEESFEEITITTWVSGIQLGAWAGLVISRDPVQPIGIDINDFSGMVNYIWNDNSSESWGFISDLFIPEDEWAFVALTIDPDKATLYMGPKGEELEYIENEIPHFAQDNFTEWRWAEDDCCGGGRNFSGLMDDVSIWNEALSLEDLQALQSGAATPLNLRTGGGVSGDFNSDGTLDADDMNELTQVVIDANHPATYDLTGDGLVDQADRAMWVEELKGTYFGDSNLDGEFNSSDFVQVFQAGQYEDNLPMNSGWESGDWNGDLDFTSSDFVTAFQAGGYELGPRGATSAVPEPGSWLLLLVGMALVTRRRQ